MKKGKEKGGQKERKREWQTFVKLLITIIKNARLPWIWLVITLILNLFGAQLTLMLPSASQRLLAGDISMGAIGFMIAIVFLQAILNGIKSLIGSITDGKVILSLQTFMLRKVMRLPLPFYDKNMADRLISRTIDDTAEFSGFLASSLPPVPSQLYTLVGSIAILFTYDWRLVALTALIIPTVFLIGFLRGRISFTWNDRIRDRSAELSGYLAEALNNIPLTKVFVQERREKQKGQAAIDELCETNKRYALFENGLSLAGTINAQIQILICILGGMVLIQRGYITFDVWMAFFMYEYLILDVIGFFPNVWNYVKSAQGISRRIAEISAEQDESAGGPRLLRQENGDIVFDHVTFGYTDQEVLKNLSFTIPQGRTTAVIGRSGEGKSTLFGLVERFYRPGEGRITMNGNDIEEYNMKAWRQSIGYVSQDAALLSGSIRDNIAYGVERKVSQEEIETAARNANAYDFIMELEHGFDTEVGVGGSKLSGGQRQRICIARELLKDPQLLLLDEATSSLDMEAEYQVEQALERLRKGRTTLVVSHRLSSVTEADQIVYLDHHQVSGVGTHDDLLQSNPSYRELVRTHLGAAV